MYNSTHKYSSRVGSGSQAHRSPSSYSSAPQNDESLYGSAPKGDESRGRLFNLTQLPPIEDESPQADLNAEYLRSMETGFVSLPRVRVIYLTLNR